MIVPDSCVKMTVFVLFFSTLACQIKNQDVQIAKKAIDAVRFAKNIQTLSSDDFEGRAPSSLGEEKTVNFLVDEFKKLGLQPGNGTSYFQEVPLVGITANSEATLTAQKGASGIEFAYARDFMAWTKRVVGRSAIRESELVFVGYGAVAPEYDWNDYAGATLAGKTVVILVNDPGFATQQDSLFRGNAMTYYGRWTYKFEEAARQGAAGALIIHEDAAAGYPWQVVTGSWAGKQFDLVSDDNNMSRCAVEGWLTSETAERIFALAGKDLKTLRAAAASRDFRPVPLGVTASLTLENDIEHSRSRNVIAVVPGTVSPEEVVIYTAHWDHFGKAGGMQGDNIFNGAVDNATGTAGLLEIAAAFRKLKNGPSRSIVFLAVTAEEQGLLGSRYYTTHPVFPIATTVAAINIDAMNVLGKMRDITIIGYGNSELDEYVREAARSQRRKVRPDPEPEKGYFYRSDHFNFAKAGVPALYTDPGIDNVAHGPDWAREQFDKYTAEKYHKPTDEYDPAWDLSGAVDDLRLLFEVGYRLANQTRFPNWQEGTEFKAKRDAALSELARQGSN